VKILIDMNLSPEWIEYLEKDGYEVSHWKDVGNPNAKDVEIIERARENGCTVFTNDLDFGRILALTHADGPSVLQIRGTLLLPEDAGDIVREALRSCKEELKSGALVTIDEIAWRVKILPIKPIGRKIK
jgi:predicted nuclease of predicted toxin-antitoxin system